MCCHVCSDCGVTLLRICAIFSSLFHAPSSELADAVSEFSRSAAQAQEMVEDAITGVKLKIIEQTLNINMEILEEPDLSVEDLGKAIDPEDLAWVAAQGITGTKGILDLGNHCPVDAPGCLKSKVSCMEYQFRNIHRMYDMHQVFLADSGFCYRLKSSSEHQKKAEIQIGVPWIDACTIPRVIEEC